MTAFEDLLAEPFLLVYPCPTPLRPRATAVQARGCFQPTRGCRHAARVYPGDQPAPPLLHVPRLMQILYRADCHRLATHSTNLWTPRANPYAVRGAPHEAMSNRSRL